MYGVYARSRRGGAGAVRVSEAAIHAARTGLLDFAIGALSGPPSEAFVAALFADDASLDVGGVNDPLDEGFDLLEAFFETNRDRSSDAIGEELAAEYARSFAEPDAPVSTRETAYREGIESAAIEAHYDASGWSPPSADSDAIVAELAFLRSLVDDQRAGHEGSVGHEKAFLDEHLSRWAGAFAASLREHSKAKFYRATASIVEGTVAFEGDFTARVLAER